MSGMAELIFDVRQRSLPTSPLHAVSGDGTDVDDNE